jgi:hypothetical protein
MAKKIFRIDDFTLERPARSRIVKAEPIRFFEGERPVIRFGDKPGYLFLFEGEIEVRLPQRTIYVVGGEVIYADAHERIEVEFVHESVRGVRIEESIPVEMGHLALQALEVPASRRTGHLLKLHKGDPATEHKLQSEKGALVLEADVAVLSSEQMQSITAYCDRELKGLAMLITPMPFARIPMFLQEDGVMQNLRRLRPGTFCIPTSLTSPFAKQQLEQIRERWLPTLAYLNIVVCLMLTYEEWPQGDYEIITQHLKGCPPSQWGIVLDLRESFAAKGSDSLINRVSQIMPWLRGVICQPHVQHQLSNVLGRFGFQGLIITESEF